MTSFDYTRSPKIFELNRKTQYLQTNEPHIFQILKQLVTTVQGNQHSSKITRIQNEYYEECNQSFTLVKEENDQP